jgi:catechol 2,3-dioxygenase-like lactoylglutathione lyase family enzyme
MFSQTIAVDDLDIAIDDYTRIGLALDARDDGDDTGAAAARFSLGQGGYIELVTCVDPTKPRGSAVAEFLQRVGEGVWRTAFEVPELASLVESSSSSDSVDQSDGDSLLTTELHFDDPSVLGHAAFDLVCVPDGWAVGDTGSSPSTWWKRLWNEAIAVPSMDQGVAAFESVGQILWDRSGREDWGLDTAVFRQQVGSFIELVSPSDPSRPTGGVVDNFMQRTGGGHYMTVIAVDDVDQVYADLDAATVRTLGPPTAAPPESPWGPVRQMWVHPKMTHGAFIEFLTEIP